MDTLRILSTFESIYLQPLAVRGRQLRSTIERRSAERVTRYDFEICAEKSCPKSALRRFDSMASSLRRAEVKKKFSEVARPCRVMYVAPSALQREKCVGLVSSLCVKKIKVAEINC